MITQTFTLKATAPFAPCPQCGNTTTFRAFAERITEDCCEVWIECEKCKHDPTVDKIGSRMEDVWGSLDPETIQAAMYVREELLE